MAKTRFYSLPNGADIIAAPGDKLKINTRALNKLDAESIAAYNTGAGNVHHEARALGPCAVGENEEVRVVVFYPEDAPYPGEKGEI